MMREAGAAILSFGLMLLIMPRLIPFLKRLKFGQTIYQLGPQSHQAKQGTPNMGGLAIALAVVVGSVAAVLCFGGADRLAALLSVSLGSLLIGFIDDFVKDVRKHHEGLKPRHKILSQFVVGIVFSFLNPLINTFWIITLRTDVPCIGAQPRTGINAQFQAHIMKVVSQFLHICKLPI